MTDEDELIEWLRGPAGAAPNPLIGDDAAILPERSSWAVTTDCQIEGVHFPEDLDPAVVARRLLAVNLSDLAAMGARPAYAFLALAAPPDFEYRRFFTALREGCAEFGLTLAGGDLARATRLTSNLTLLGGRRPGGRWLPRSDARPGHTLWVGGSLGQAATGLALVLLGARWERGGVRLPEALEVGAEVLAAARDAVHRHLLPRPQLELGAWLASQSEGGAIDISDGLAKDLHRLARRSGVGAVVELERLPTAPEHDLLAGALGLEGAECALAGGEDYVLLFTLPEGTAPPRQLECSAIGKILGETRISLREGGRERPLPPMGWDHLRNS